MAARRRAHFGLLMVGCVGAVMLASAVVGAQARAGSALPVLSTLAVASAKGPLISWADAKHRYGWVNWEPPGRRYYCSRDGRVLCATNDGGKHWHAILEGYSGFFSYLRWSKDAGVVSTGAYGHFEFWTRDGGRHWWATDAFSLGAYVDAYGYGAGPRFSVGRGEDGRRQLRYAYSPRLPYRVLGWVPTRPLTCVGEWRRLWGQDGIGPENVCFAPVGGDGMTALPVGPAAPLTVTVNSETGEGLVTSSPVGIYCGTFTPVPNTRRPACAASFPQGETVSLRASANPSPREVGWSGCSRLRPASYPDDPATAPPVCDVSLAEDTQVTATFHRN